MLGKEWRVQWYAGDMDTVKSLTVSLRSSFAVNMRKHSWDFRSIRRYADSQNDAREEDGTLWQGDYGKGSDFCLGHSVFVLTRAA